MSLTYRFEHERQAAAETVKSVLDQLGLPEPREEGIDRRNRYYIEYVARPFIDLPPGSITVYVEVLSGNRDNPIFYYITFKYFNWQILAQPNARNYDIEITDYTTDLNQLADKVRFLYDRLRQYADAIHEFETTLALLFLEPVKIKLLINDEPSDQLASFLDYAIYDANDNRIAFDIISGTDPLSTLQSLTADPSQILDRIKS